VNSLPSFAGTGRGAVTIGVGVFLALFAIELSLMLWLNGGLFMYTLDDAYIHFALAENLIRGHYGVNLGEVSAPCSSIIWPFLLAPLMQLPGGYWLPLVVNVLLTVATIVVFHRLIEAAFPASAWPERRWMVPVVLVGAIIATNLLGLSFSGMEHTLQVLLAAAMVLGMIRDQEEDRPSRWFYAAIVVGPLVRYELLALSLPALAYLAWRRRLRAAILCGLLIAIPVGAFSAFLMSNGLGPLPTSVTAKLTPLYGGGNLPEVFKTISRNLGHRQGALLTLSLIVLLPAVFSRRPPIERAFATWSAAAVLMHLAIGKFGWYNRYEIYIWASTILALMYLHRAGLGSIFFEGSRLRAATFLGVFIGGACYPYLHVFATLPIASNNVHEMHYQMHRFITEFHPRPVAVNDLGWTSYRNDEYVLDLWGLASRDALKLRTHRDVTDWDSRDWLREQAETYGVDMAMIFEIWFPEIPEKWTALADLTLSKPRIIPARHTVTFFAMDPDDVPEMTAKLEAFRRTLPKGVRFRFREGLAARR
jgi:hypothetical protein